MATQTFGDALGMTTEHRQVIFSNQELILALIGFDCERSKELPPAKTVICVIGGDELVRATLIFCDPAGGEKRAFEFEADHLVAVLIRDCANRGIPVPKQAKKILRASGDGVSLNFTLIDERSDSSFRQSA